MKNRLRKVLKGFGFAFSGISNSFKTEINFRIHVGATFIALLMGVVFRLSIIEWLWIVLAICLVLAAELMNTAIESLANIISPDFHPLIKKAKDAAAGAVLIIALFAFIIAVIIFGAKVVNLISYPV